MSWACRKPLSHATKSYRVNRPLRQAHDMIYDCCVILLPYHNSFAVILSSSLFTIWAKYRKNTEIDTSSYKVKIENRKFSVACSRCRQNLKFGNFTSSLGPIYTVRLCRMRQRLTTSPRLDLRLLCTSEKMS